MAEAAKIRIGNYTYYDARQLSDLTYGRVPEDDRSAGALWLRTVAEQYSDLRDELREDSDWQDRISEVADSVSSISDLDVWRVVTDLRLFSDAEAGLLDYGLWTTQYSYLNLSTYREENVNAVRFDKISDALRWWLYETSSVLIYALRQADTEERES